MIITSLEELLRQLSRLESFAVLAEVRHAPLCPNVFLGLRAISLTSGCQQLADYCLGSAA